MSTAYRPPFVDDLPGSCYVDDTQPSDQAWLAPGPGDGLMRAMDAVPAPATFSSTSAQSAHDASDKTAPEGHHMLADDTSTPSVPRARPRSATVRRHSSMPSSGPESPTRRRTVAMEPATQSTQRAQSLQSLQSIQSTLDEVNPADPESSSDETVVPPADSTDIQLQYANCPASPTKSTLTSFTSLTDNTHGSGSSSGSGSTITQASWPRRRGSDKSRGHEKVFLKGRRQSRSPKTQQQHQHQQQQQQQQQQHFSNVLTYLEPDSPHVTPEVIQRSVDQSAYWRMPEPSSFQSPSTRSNASTASSSFQSDVFSEMPGDHETDRSSSPDHSAYGDSPSMPGKFEVQMAAAAAAAAHRQQQDCHSYGISEMPRGTANLPHLPPNALQPRLPGVQNGHTPKHLPRAEILPLTGYELMASKLCAPSTAANSDPDRLAIKPIYRRFEALNHRLLLHLQDELAELEEQLHRIDTADTQTRRMQNCFLPASRRQDALTAGELQWHKTDVLGRIGYKISQYNQVLSSFKETQHLPAPDPRDVDVYRAYLANQNPIVDVETRFLDPLDDLVSLARPSPSSSNDSFFSGDELKTPQQQQQQPQRRLRLPAMNLETGNRAERARRLLIAALTGFLPTLALAFAAAFLLPILAFAVIPGFVGRMAVVFLVAVGVAAGVVQAGLFSGGVNRPAKVAATEGLLASGVYVGVMAVVAGIFG
ncbi:hypothetical protein CTA2_2754 [Colletotrichum tanaceti]|uniref:DUF6594 domain-containing protein n=1 Tax=Colletotrichum tanaceti TaxID=1306861 RepID=A0A4U6XHA7_9PEZI|nr:hypothetical protein CTA2_2754 [Colletotrichum tanaceti]TKW55290.1 hypothetical protein CTA1_1142 [Colletotrichum tanaceti]